MSCSKPCHNYSVFSFHVVGRHCLVKILRSCVFVSLEVSHILFHIGNSVYSNKYSCVSLQCPVLSLVKTILSFLFMLLVGIVW